jgi:hypothetical protein
MTAVLPLRSLLNTGSDAVFASKVGLESSFAKMLDGKIGNIVLEDS